MLIYVYLHFAALYNIIMNIELKEIVDIKFGFQGQPDADGDVVYFQVKQFDDDGKLINGIDEKIKFTEKAESHLLQRWDVLFVAKGNRLFAWCYADDSIPAIASSSFFVLRPKNNNIDSNYLAAILNATQYKNALLQLGGGSNILSIRKPELGAFEIPLIPMEKQKLVAKIASLHESEVAIRKRIITRKQDVFKSVISKIS